MAGYRFYPAADLAQDKIWRDTREQWGEAQAEIYIRGLHDHLLWLSRTKTIWRRLPDFNDVKPKSGKQAFFSRYRKHLVFFRELKDGSIGVMSILHERMDITARLSEDLAKLDPNKS